MGAEVSPKELREALSFPEGWGPSEWGPIPYLPDPDFLIQRMEGQWGSLLSYRGLATSAKGKRPIGTVGMLAATLASRSSLLGHRTAIEGGAWWSWTLTGCQPMQ